MTTIIFIVLIFITLNSSFTQMMNWSTLLQSAPYGYYTMKTYYESNKLYVVTSNHYLLKTTNNGVTFDSIHNPNITFRDMEILGQNQIIGGQFGSIGIIKSTNDGLTWNNIYTVWRPTTLFKDGNYIWGGNEDGLIFKSSNNGENWESILSPTNNNINNILADSPYVFIITSQIIKSSDYGLTWQNSSIGSKKFICKDSQNNLWILSDNNLMRSTDYGETWEINSTLSFPTYLDIDNYDNLYYSNHIGVYRSTNYGVSWNIISSINARKMAFIDSTIFLYDINNLYVNVPDTFFENGRNMFPLQLNNKYQYMSGTTSGSFGYTYNLYEYEINSDTIIDNKKYFKFNNNNYKYRNEIDSNISYIRLYDNEKLFINFNLIHGSQFLQEIPINTIKFVQTGYMEIFGLEKKFFRVNSSQQGSSSYEFYAEDIGKVKSGGTSSPGSNSGSSTLINAIIYDSLGNYSYYTNGHKPVITFEPFTFLHLNLAKKFTVKVSHVYNRIKSMFGNLSDAVVYVDSVIFEYYNNKDTIGFSRRKVSVNKFPLTDDYNFTIKLDTTFYKPGDKLMYRIIAKDKAIIPEYSFQPIDGYFEAFIYGPPPTNVEDGDINKLEYKLLQNYPNPFNPVTIINFQLPSAGNVELKVYDVLGREVAVLVNNYLESGNHNIEFITEEYNLNSGVYFYQLRAGEFVETRKMILLK